MADIVIFDETNSHIVRQALSTHHSIAVFNVRPEDIWIGGSIIYNFFFFLRKFNFREALKGRRGLAQIRGIFGQLRCIYFASCLATMKPKAVITFIDNSGSFHWLSKHCRLFPFIAIQNGARPRWGAQENSGYHLQHLFCLGAHEMELFPKMGYTVEHFYPVGSLLASLYFAPRQAAPDVKYDLLIVSAWRGNIGYTQDVKDTMRSMKLMDQLLAQYLRSRSIKAAVITRSERNSKDWLMPEIGMTEEGYYREIFGDTIHIIDSDFGKGTIFPLLQQSHVIVACLSSALIEAFGIGKKVLYFNFTGTDFYHQDLPSSITSNDSAYESFAARLDELLSMSPEEYRQRDPESPKYYMSNPTDRPTYQAIAEQIDQIIASHHAAEIC